jgi:RNA polymerase sigma-70 factor (ECF subfamily)
MSREKAIIQKFKQGDAAAYDTLYRSYCKKMYSFSLGIVKDPETAGEIVQEVFVKLWEKRSQIDTDFNFENYLYTMTLNSIRKFYRKKSVEHKVKDYLLNNSIEILDNVDSSLIYNELYELANRMIERLPPRRRIVYKLSRQDDMEIKEIARKLNISTRTVENHLTSALKCLREEIASLT